MSDLPTVWQPSPFEGADLLPTGIKQNDLEVVGDDDIGDEDTILPVLKMLQGTAVNDVEGARAGQFYNTVTKELFDGPIRVLIIAHSKGNSFFAPDGTDLKDCYSLDGVTGSEYGDCFECGRTQWDRSTTPHTKPSCNKQHKVIVMTPSGPAMMRFQGKSYKAMQGIFTAKKQMRKNFFDHPAIIAAEGPFVSEKPGGKKFTYYTLSAKWATNEEIPLEVRKTALETYKAIRDAQSHGRLKGADDEDQATGKANTSASPDYGDVPF